MRRHIISAISLTLVTAGLVNAETFERTAIAPDVGVEVLNRSVARRLLGREIFSNPYATVTLGSIDIYDVFPYVESRHFQIISDPSWNRLVYGEEGKSLHAYSGNGGALGPLSEPHGMAVDEHNRIYVADSGNDRIVVLQAVTEFDAMTLIPLYEIRGLSRPFDVAHSDGGTPFEFGDDHLYVADTGKNRVVAFSLEESGAREVAVIGDLGSGIGHFAGPMAIATGRSASISSPDIYVADAHNCRIVHLRHEGNGLDWIGDRHHDADILTSIDTDHWGNVYAAAPNRNAIYKFNPALTPVAALHRDVDRPRSFHIPILNVHDHRTGKVERRGQSSGLVVESWTEMSGVKRWNLGVEVADLAVVNQDEAVARFTLTDQAVVSLEITDASSGRMVARRNLGSLAAGLHSIPLSTEELGGAPGGNRRLLRVSAVSSYGDAPSDVAETSFTVNGSGVLPPKSPVLLGNTPNPALQGTRIAFLLPNGVSDPVSLHIYDARGRLVRRLTNRFASGLNEVDWDGRDNGGSEVSAGVYFYRLRVAGVAFTRRMVFIR